MTTATANRAPTEAELRAIIERHQDQRLPDPADFAFAFVSPIEYVPEDEIGNHVNRVWDNLRPEEAERLTQLMDEVFTVAERELAIVEERCREAAVRAALTFAAEYPDAPRARAEDPA